MLIFINFTAHRAAVEPEEKATDDFHYERFKKQMRRYWAGVKNSLWKEKSFRI